MMLSRTHEQFLVDFEKRQPVLFNSIEILENYVKAKTLFLVKTKYGNCKTNSDRLLRGDNPSIVTAIDKNQYFKNQLRDLQPEIFNNIEILGEYNEARSPILIRTKHGECLTTPDKLLQGSNPSIRTAVNPQEYFINQAKEVHGDLYDYSEVNYINNAIKVKIISEEGVFYQSPNNHLKGRGCPVINKRLGTYNDNDYVNKALNSKNFNNFKVYIIKCWNDNEIFYKIGKSFMIINQRFGGKKKMPYNYSIIEEITFEKSEKGGLKCCQKERELQAKNKEFKYIPKIPFAGIYECFSKIK